MADPLLAIDGTIEFSAIAVEVDSVAPRPSGAQGDRPPFPTEVMVRVLILKHLNSIADEAQAFRLLDRLSFQRFCGLTDSSNVPDRITFWTFEQRLREAGATSSRTPRAAPCTSRKCLTQAIRAGMSMSTRAMPVPSCDLSIGCPRDDSEGC